MNEQDTIRKLAEATMDYGIRVLGWSGAGRTSDFIAAFTAVWPQVFAVPDGSVKVRIAVSRQLNSGKEWIRSYGIDGYDTEEEAIDAVAESELTHGPCIIEAYLPPVHQPPVVQGTVQEPQ